MLIILIAIFFRFYQLPSLPPGLNFDEAGNGVAALEILNGLPRLWWQIGGGKEAVWPYILALGTALLGNIPYTLRFFAAVSGILTIAAVCPLLRRLFHRQHGQALALLTMLGVTLSPWHLHFSRLGFRAILLPLFSILAFYFLWRTLTETTMHPRATFHVSQPSLILAALFLALSIYSYLAARLLPVVIILFFALTALKTFFNRKKIPQSPNLLIPILLPLFVYLILFLLLLIIYFIANPADFVARSGAVSIFNPEWNNGDLVGTAWQTLILSLSTFVGLNGDSNPLVNLPHQPAIPLTLVPFFLIGLIIVTYRSFSTSKLPNPHLFLLCWWLVMLLPALLAPEGAPHHLRLIGTLIPSHTLIALGFITIIKSITSLIPHPTPHSPRPISHLPRPLYLIPLLCYLFVAGQTFTNYFIRWPQTTDFTLPFDLYATRLATDMAQAPATTAYILPMDIRAATEARHYTIDYLLSTHNYQPPIPNPQSPTPPPHTYIPVDETNAETLLTQAAAGKGTLKVIRWTEDKHREADAKEIITFLLSDKAQLVERETFPVYDIETYQILDACEAAACPPISFTLPAIEQPIFANFANLLQINSAYIQPVATAGNFIRVAITIAPLNLSKTNYKTSLRLTNSTGQRVAQKDRTLRHNFHQGTSLWPPETVNEYYLLPVPAEATPGEYTVSVVLYHPDTQAPLVADGLVEVPLGIVTIN